MEQQQTTINKDYMFYRCDLIDGEFGVGPESLESGLYQQADIPWDQIAFPVVHETLSQYFVDAEARHFPVRVSTVERRPRRP